MADSGFDSGHGARARSYKDKRYRTRLRDMLCPEYAGLSIYTTGALPAQGPLRAHYPDPRAADRHHN